MRRLQRQKQQLAGIVVRNVDHMQQAQDGTHTSRGGGGGSKLKSCHGQSTCPYRSVLLPVHANTLSVHALKSKHVVWKS